MSDLASKTCVPCRGGVPPLAGEELAKLSREVPQWKIVDGHHIVRSFAFPDFREALAFVNKVGAIAEEQGHHPDIFLTWGKRTSRLGRTRLMDSRKVILFWLRR